jgi:hypothetical protein
MRNYTISLYMFTGPHLNWQMHEEIHVVQRKARDDLEFTEHVEEHKYEITSTCFSKPIHPNW